MKRITFHNLAKASAQQVFDFVAAHMLKQNKQCKEGDRCRYRVETGKHKKVLKCAAGCLIPRKDYQKRMEGKGWDWVSVSLDLQNPHCNLIQSLQRIHDGNTPDTWKKKLENMARDRDLVANF